MRTNKALPD